MPIDPTKVITIPTNINVGLTSPSNATLIQILGMPRDVIDHKHRAVTNQPLKSLIRLDDVGPFRVTGCRPAVESLARIMKQVKKHVPEVFAVITSAGMLTVRLIGGSSKISNHSWGCALDISMAGVLDGLGNTKRDGQTLAGLAAIAPFFHAEGWYWGVGFSNFEDGMPFEVADETLRKWHADGEFGKRVADRAVHTPMLTRGDRGEGVKRLQKALIELDYDILMDGDFGPITHAHVINFQAEHGLVPDGVVGPKTWKALADAT
jgi:murein L,D-transpeptidase YcbB/YkuD